MEIGVLGVNHRTAPVDVRERMALPGEHTRNLLRAMRADGSFREALVLDTCNRTEIYFAADRCSVAFARLVELIGQARQVIADPLHFYQYRGIRAVRHLFSVAASLDSQILGEDQILNQLKDAYRIACEEGTVRFMLNKLLQRAFRAGKRVRTETGLGCGSPSVAQAAVNLCRNLMPDFSDKTVLVVGAGRTAELAAQLLVRNGVGKLTLANRTLSRATHVAHTLQRLYESYHATAVTCAPHSRSFILAGCGQGAFEGDRRTGGQGGGEATGGPAGTSATCGTSVDGKSASWVEQPAPAINAVGLDGIPSAIAEADLALCCTASPNLVLTHDSLAPVLRRHEGRPLFIVDVAVPRDADPRLSGLPNVFLYNIDDLECEHIEADNARVMDKARAIVEHEVCQFSRWLDSLQMAPTIKLLHRRFDLIRQTELGKFEHRISGLDREQLERMARRICGKILHKPMAYLHSLPESPDDTMSAIELIRRLFDLDSLENMDEPDCNQKPQPDRQGEP